MNAVVLLTLKLVLVPFLILLATLAAKRWGHQVSGILSSFPIVAGPILLFFAFEQGEVFAANAAARSLLGMFALTAFCITFCIAAKRVGWISSYLFALGCYFCACVVLAKISNPALVPALVLVYIAIFFALRTLPKMAASSTKVSIPTHELVARMVLAEVLVATLTTAAAMLGPNWSGILAPFPVAGSAMGIFTLRNHGKEALNRLMRGFIAGFYSFASFLFTVAWFLQTESLGLSFVVATVVAISVHSVLLVLAKLKK